MVGHNRKALVLVVVISVMTIAIQTVAAARTTKRPNNLMATLSESVALATSPSVATAAPKVLIDSKWNLESDGKCRQPRAELSSDENGELPTDHLADWVDINEIKFITGSAENHLQGNQKLWCKIKCVEGEWVGPLCSSDGENGRYQPLLKACPLQVPEESRVILSYHDHHKPLEPGMDVMIPHGTVILGRCPVLGTMKLLGVPSIQCRDGQWSHKLPTCLSTTPNLTIFTDDYPPAIKINIPSGSAGENSAGELVVRPDSIIHFDCVFYRRLGTPSWSWTGLDQSRTYPIGWAMASDERLWRYRISLFSIQMRDEGEFTCATPKGFSNSIRIIVRTIQCPPLGRIELPLKSSIPAHLVGKPSYAGESIIFSCADGYRLQGPNSTSCLTSGLWSESEKPYCELIQCPFDIDGADPRLEFEFTDVGFNGVVKYTCPPGYKLIGSTNATCQETMNWFPPPPICEAIECPQLLPPLNGRVIDSGSHFVGDTVKFSCNRNFILVGEALVTCTEDGNWSSNSPQCQLLCNHPGSPLNGFLSPNSTHYEIGASVLISCLPNYKYQSRPWLVCQQDGSWSSSVGPCVQQD